MADYININGNNIPIRASDPTNPIVGEIWYNSTTNLLKGQALSTSGTWSTSGTMNTGRGQASGLGTLTAGLAAGTQSPTPNQVLTEEYDGSTWSVGGNLNDGRADLNTFGVQTAGIAAAGDDFPNSPRGTTAAEEYNGSTWTSNPTGLNTVRRGVAAAGIQTAALSSGGEIPGTGFTGATEEYNGSTWTTVSSLATARGLLAGAGTTSAALAFGGNTGSRSGATEEWLEAGALTTKTITVS